MGIKKERFRQKEFLFKEEEIWQQLPAAVREQVVKVLVEIYRDYHYRRQSVEKRENHV